jgi:hypothetical protein
MTGEAAGNVPKGNLRERRLEDGSSLASADCEFLHQPNVGPLAFSRRGRPEMIAAVQSDEHEPTTKREVCARCHKPVIPHEETDHGPLCRPCTLEATEIRLEYVIDGRIYSKSLKGRLRSVVPAPGA